MADTRVWTFPPPPPLITSLPLKKAPSSVGADRGSGETRPMVYPCPPMDATTPPLAINQVRTHPPRIYATPMKCAIPHWTCHLPSQRAIPPPLTCHPPPLARCGVWRWAAKYLGLWGKISRFKFLLFIEAEHPSPFHIFPWLQTCYTFPQFPWSVCAWSCPRITDDADQDIKINLGFI